MARTTKHKHTPVTMDGDFDPVILEPNPNRLDAEWAKQPRLFWDWADALSTAEDALRKAEARAAVRSAEVKKAYARLELQIRANPGKFGIDRTTDTAIARKLLIQADKDKDVVRAEKKAAKMDAKVLRLKHRVDVLYRVLKALDHRLEALRHLVQLQGRNYYQAHMRNPNEVEGVVGSRKRRNKHE